MESGETGEESTISERVDCALDLQSQIIDTTEALFSVIAGLNPEGRREFMQELGRRAARYSFEARERDLVRHIVRLSDRVNGGKTEAHGESLRAYFDQARREAETRIGGGTNSHQIRD